MFRSNEDDGFWRLSTHFAVGGVTVKGGKVKHCAPIFSKFKGQLFSNLKRWNKVVKAEKLE